jgi:hypothetical protein
MDLEMEALEPLETPMSREFWDGFFAGASVVLAAAGLAAGIIVLT